MNMIGDEKFILCSKSETNSGDSGVCRTLSHKISGCWSMGIPLTVSYTYMKWRR